MGHVNNAVYLTYLEQARFASLARRRHARSELDSAPADGGVPTDIPGVIVARVEIDYRRPAKYGDLLEIRLGIAAIGRTSFTYEYEIVDADERAHRHRAHGDRPLRLCGRTAGADLRRAQSGAHAESHRVAVDRRGRRIRRTGERSQQASFAGSSECQPVRQASPGSRLTPL